ncbi:MAG: hypothetical protein E6902_14600 [Paeniclostridium sordellii]|nr:hypothetical protein [Paeniclostridium sordellii]
MGKILKFKTNFSKKEVIWSLLNQDLLTCLQIFIELIEIDLTSFKSEEIINAIIIEQLQEFSDYYWWVDEDSFNYDFKNSINDFKKNILNKAKDKNQVLSVFEDLILFINKLKNQEISLESELEVRKYLENEGIECWCLLNQDLLRGIFILIEILGGIPTGTNGDHLINDLILSKLQEFIDCYKKKNEEELKEWIEDFKKYTLSKSRNKKLIKDIFENLLMLECELNENDKK